ncbi:hypothetical protein EPN28_02445 [Patescibacteria group bacterium]|nr:MAG: hypothetical protein EPN28_02445 [Patescibacteria group bacterium]
MNQRERSIAIGCVLGDGFLQKTGEKNARLRLEHSSRQKEYIFWKWRELERYMQSKPKYLTRFNPIWRKQYAYYRCQSHSSPEFGKLHALFYENGDKQVPKIIEKLFDPLVLAVWFMDDGYYYKRDKTAYIYLSKLNAESISGLKRVFAKNFNLHPKLELKKTKAMDLKFCVKDTRKLQKIIAPYVIESMRYKIDEEPRID